MTYTQPQYLDPLQETSNGGLGLPRQPGMYTPQATWPSPVDMVPSMQESPIAGAPGHNTGQTPRGKAGSSPRCQKAARRSPKDALLSYPAATRGTTSRSHIPNTAFSKAQAMEPKQITMPQHVAYSSLRGALGELQDLKGAPGPSQAIAQCLTGAEQNTTKNSTLDVSGPLSAQIHQETVTPAHEGQDEEKPAYEYKLYVDRYSITLVHADPTVGIEGIGPTISRTKSESYGDALIHSRLYRLAIKYSGNSLPPWMPALSQAQTASDKGDPEMSSDRKGPGESCVMCSSSKRKCPAALGGLCKYCEDARPHPLPTVYSLPQRGTGQKSKFRKLLKKADRVFRLYAAGTSYLSPAEESALRKVVKVGSHKGEVYLLPSGAFVLV